MTEDHSQALRQITRAVEAAHASLAEAWGRAQPAMADAADSIGRLGAELESGYRQAAANLAVIRAQRPVTRLRQSR